MIYDFGTSNRKIPMRERHFHTAAVVLCAMILSNIPCLSQVESTRGTMSYYAHGTLMHIGTRPFALSGLITSFNICDEKHEPYIGLALSLVMILTQTLDWVVILQLFAVSVAIVNAMRYLDTYGSISLTTALIFMQASEIFIRDFFSYSTIIVLAMMGLIVWLDQVAVTVPMTHIRRRTQQVSMRLPLMYNSTSALITYATIAEMFISNKLLYTTLLFPSVHYMNKHLPTIHKTTGRDLIHVWGAEKYAVRGWHSKQRMAKHVQTLIDRNIWWNTICTCAMWAIATMCKTSITPSTIFLLTSTAKQYLHQPLLSQRG